MKPLFSATLLALLFTLPVNAKNKDRRELKITACSEKTAGDACTFAGKKGERSGLCKASKEDSEKLICRDKKNGKRGKRGNQSAIIKKLDLSKEQYAKLKEYREKDKETKAERKPLREKIKSLREDVKKGFINNESDKKMLEMHREIAQLRSKLEEFRFTKMITLKNVLNEDQRKKYFELKDSLKKKQKKSKNK